MNENEFLIELLAKLDEEASKGKINSDIETIRKNIKELQLQATIDPRAVENIRKQIESISNQKITISNIGIDTKSGIKAGQEYGKQISQGISQGMKDNTSVLNSFKKSLENIGMGSEEIDAVANRIYGLVDSIESLNQSISHSVRKRGSKDILSVDISGVDKLGQAIKLTEQYDMANGKLIKSIDAVSTIQQKAGTTTNTVAKQQAQSVANLTNQINQLNRAANDQNATRPISDSSHLNSLSTAYNEIISAIQRMANASKDTFTDEQNNVRTLISNYKSLVSEFRNAENISSKMKGTDIASGLEIARNDLEKFKADAKDFPSIIKTINDLDSAIVNVGDASSLNAFNDQLRVARSELAKIKSEATSTNRNEKVGINISGLTSKITDLQRLSPEINKFEVEINNAKVTIQSLLDDLSKVSTQGDFSVINSKWKAFTDAAKSAGIAITEVVTKSDSLASQINKIQGLSNGTIKNDYSSQIAKLEGNFRNLGFTAEEVKEKTSNVASAFENLRTRVNQPFDESNYQEIISLNDTLQKELAESNNEYTRLSASTKGYVTVQQRLSKANVIEAWNQKNSGASQDVLKVNEAYVASLRDLNSQMSKMQFNEITDGFKRTENSMRGIGKLGASVKEQFAQATKSFTQLFSIGSIVATVINQLRKVPQAVYEIDTAMTNLYKVTDETESKYASFLNSASDSANKLGRSMSGLIEQTANWAKLGFSLDESSKLAEISSIYANVGEVDDSTAVSDIVTAMKAFNIEASDSITIVDKLNKLGNEYATSAKDLGDGLSRSASAMSTAGTDINKTLAMLTGGTEITQNASEFGNFLKIGSMRIRGMKGELEELGEEVDETVDSVSKIQTQILNRTGGKVNIFDDMDNFRDYYDIMEDIAKIYNDLSDTNKADLMEILFGKQRGNQGAALIQAFQSGQIQKALTATLNAEGSAMQEQERWLGSLEAKTQQFEAAFQSLSNTVIDSNIVKEFVDLGTSGVSALDGIAKVLGNINSLGGNISSVFGTIGAASGLLMNKNGIGERTMFQWRIVHAPTLLKLCNNAT